MRIGDWSSDVFSSDLWSTRSRLGGRGRCRPAFWRWRRASRAKRHYGHARGNFQGRFLTMAAAVSHAAPGLVREESPAGVSLGSWLLLAGLASAAVMDAVNSTVLSIARAQMMGSSHATPDRKSTRLNYSH